MKRIISHRDPEATTFPLIDSSDNNAFYCFLFAPLGLLFLFASIFGIWHNRNPMMLIMLAISLYFIFFGFTTGMHCFQELDIAGDTIRLMLGPVVLQEMPVTEIKTLAYGIVRVNYNKGSWCPHIILLSPQSPQHMLEIGKALANFAGGPLQSLSRVGTDPQNHRAQMDYYVNSRMTNLNLTRGEGFWMEYSPERIEILKQLIPQAEDFVSPVSEVTP